MMSILPNKIAQQPIPFSWAGYIEQEVGFVLPPAQHYWLSNAVLAVAGELGLDEQTLSISLDNPDIRQKLIDAVLIPETRFFRDNEATQFVAQSFDTHLKSQTTPFLVASIGCSTGQELWSLAMVLEQKRQAYAMLYNAVPCDFELIGVDASARSLTIATTAMYNERMFLEIPKIYHRFWQKTETMWRIIPSLTHKGRFINCNLFSSQDFQDKLSFYAHKLSLVLCQNMLIYFRRFDQRDILSRVAGLVRPEGFLLLGAGEGLFWQPTDMIRLNKASVNGWQKR